MPTLEPIETQGVPEPEPVPTAPPTANLTIQLDVRGQRVVFSVNELHIGLSVAETLQLSNQLRLAANKLGNLINHTRRLAAKKPTRG